MTGLPYEEESLDTDRGHAMMEVATGGLYLQASGHQGLLEATRSWGRSLARSLPLSPRRN